MKVDPFAPDTLVLIRWEGPPPAFATADLERAQRIIDDDRTARVFTLPISALEPYEQRRVPFLSLKRPR